MLLCKTPLDLYNMLEKYTKAEHDMICSRNESYNIREDKIIIWDRSEIFKTLFNSGIMHNSVEENRDLALHFTCALIILIIKFSVILTI